MSGSQRCLLKAQPLQLRLRAQWMYENALRDTWDDLVDRKQKLHQLCAIVVRSNRARQVEFNWEVAHLLVSDNHQVYLQFLPLRPLPPMSSTGPSAQSSTAQICPRAWQPVGSPPKWSPGTAQGQEEMVQLIQHLVNP